MKSIAILGASNNKEKFGNKAVRVYKELGWKVFPVNPKEHEIEGLKCFHSLLDLPEKPDSVSVYLPPEISIKLVDDFVSFGIREVILNPGAESVDLVSALKEKGIKPLLVCSIRAVGVNPADY